MAASRDKILIVDDQPSVRFGLRSSEDYLSLDELERLHIQQVLAATERNLSRRAEILSVTRTTLYNKLRRYQLENAGEG